jgi:Fibronectin type III domain
MRKALIVTNDATNPTTALDLSWGAASGATGYYVYQAATIGGLDDDPTLVATTSEASCVISGLTPGTEYAFSIEAYNSYGITAGPGDSAALATEPVTTLSVNDAVSPPTATTITVLLSVSLGSEITNAGYVWTTSPSIGNPTSVGAGYYEWTGLTPGTTYQIQAATEITSENGDWSGTITGPASTALLVATAGFPIPYAAGVSGCLGITRADRARRVEGTAFVYRYN